MQCEVSGRFIQLVFLTGKAANPYRVLRPPLNRLMQ